VIFFGQLLMFLRKISAVARYYKAINSSIPNANGNNFVW